MAVFRSNANYWKTFKAHLTFAKEKVIEISLNIMVRRCFSSVEQRLFVAASNKREDKLTLVENLLIISALKQAFNAFIREETFISRVFTLIISDFLAQVWVLNNVYCAGRDCLRIKRNLSLIAILAKS